MTKFIFVVGGVMSGIGKGITVASTARILKDYGFKVTAVKIENADEQTGVEIIRRALEEPLRQIAANAGKEASVIMEQVKKGKDAYGYNADTDEYGDLIQFGIVDPVKVTRSALQNAASAAAMFLTTEAVITDIPEEKQSGPGGMSPMGGMGDY